MKKGLFFCLTSLLFGWVQPASGLVTSITAQDECSNSFAGCFEISGVISSQDLVEVRAIADRIAASTKRTTFFRLNSQGGNVEAAINIGRQLRRLSAIAAMTEKEECLSSCVFILAGATQRVIGGIVGIHRPYSPRTDQRDYTAVQKDHRRIATLAKTYLEEMNLPPQLYDAMERIPPEKIRVLSKKELEEFGLAQIDPVEQELQDAAEARKYGLSKIEFLRRKANSGQACDSQWSFGQKTGNFDEYFRCKEQIMRGISH
jgi:hypothetical protein